MKILFMLTVFSGLCGVCMAQQKKGNNKSQWADLALTAGSSQGAGVLSYVHSRKLGKKKKLGPVQTQGLPACMAKRWTIPLPRQNWQEQIQLHS